MKTLSFRNILSNGSFSRSLGTLSLLTAMLFIFSFTSCSDDDDEAQKYAVKITVNYPAGYTENLASGLQVKAASSTTGTEVSATTDDNGVAQFSLISGIYSFTVSQETEEFAFNGILENVTVAEDKTYTIDLHASTLSGGLVFKEYYYAGSPTESGGSYYSDQFMEIYNNSDDTIYLDNIGIGSLDPTTSNSPSVWVDEQGNLLDKLPVGSYSFYIKGSGKDHPLEPRTSIVIAQDGINHKTDPLGNPLSPVNLGNASWETYVGDINGGKDADAPGVPNLTLLHATMTSMFDALYSIFGPALVLFRFPADVDPAAFASDDTNLALQPGSSSTFKYLMIPKDYVIDAIECVNSDESKRYKRIPSDLDAGYTFTNDSYTGKSVRRKVKQIIDGKVIYKDTNNSTEDFLREQTPSPFVHPTSADN